MAASGIFDAAQPPLDELAQATGELARLAVIEGDQLIRVTKAQGARSGLRYDPDAGSEVYLAATANGLARLVAMSEERALQLIAHRRPGHGTDRIDGARHPGHAARIDGASRKHAVAKKDYAGVDSCCCPGRLPIAN